MGLCCESELQLQAETGAPMPVYKYQGTTKMPETEMTDDEKALREEIDQVWTKYAVD